MVTSVKPPCDLLFVNQIQNYRRANKQNPFAVGTGKGNTRAAASIVIHFGGYSIVAIHRIYLSKTIAKITAPITRTVFVEMPPVLVPFGVVSEPEFWFS